MAPQMISITFIFVSLAPRSPKNLKNLSPPSNFKKQTPIRIQPVFQRTIKYEIKILETNNFQPNAPDFHPFWTLRLNITNLLSHLKITYYNVKIDFVKPQMIILPKNKGSDINRSLI